MYKYTCKDIAYIENNWPPVKCRLELANYGVKLSETCVETRLYLTRQNHPDDYPKKKFALVNSDVATHLP